MSELISVIFLWMALLSLLVIIGLIFIHSYQIFAEPDIQKRMRKLRKPVQPWVTVLVYARNNETGTRNSLKALLRSQYHNFDVVIVKDYSGNIVEALKKGYQKSQHGKVVISLQAGVIAPPSFIKRAVAMKGERRQISLRVTKPMLTSSLVQIVHSLSDSLWQRGSRVRVSGAKNIVSPKNMPRVDFLITALFVGIVSLSLVTNELIIVWYSWLIFTSFLLSTIWLNEEKIMIKIQLSFSAISAFFLLPVASLAVWRSQFSSRN